jgi:hypothetical protein
LEDRIELIKKGFDEDSLFLENEEMETAFTKFFLQIDSMKTGLLQANNDAMRISTRIIKELKGNS